MLPYLPQRRPQHHNALESSFWGKCPTPPLESPTVLATIAIENPKAYVEFISPGNQVNNSNLKVQTILHNDDRRWRLYYTIQENECQKIGALPARINGYFLESGRLNNGEIWYVNYWEQPWRKDKDFSSGTSGTMVSPPVAPREFYLCAFYYLDYIGPAVLIRGEFFFYWSP